MKKVFLIFSFLFGIMNFSYSQYPVCNCSLNTFDAPMSQYSYNKGNSGVELVSFINNGVMCYCEVYYRIKICINPNTNLENKEIYIEKIVFDPNCVPTDKSAAITAAVRMMVKFAPIYFSNSSLLLPSYRVSVVTPKCWSINSTSIESDSLSCGKNCCKTEYFVNKNPNLPTFNITDKNKEYTVNDCGGISGATCTYYCNANDLPYGPIDDPTLNMNCTDVDPCFNETWNDAWQAWNDMYLAPQTEVFTTHIIRDDIYNSCGYMSYKRCQTGEDCLHLIKIDKVNLTANAAVNLTDEEILHRVIKGALWRINGLLHERIDPTYKRDYITKGCNYISEGFFAKVLMAKCWKRINTWNGIWLVPCSESNCYEPVTYQIKYTIDNSILYPYGKQTILNPATQADNISKVECGNGCSSCSWDAMFNVFFQGWLYLPKISTIEGVKTKPVKENLHGFNVVPNPAKNHVLVSLTNEWKNFTLEFVNSTGEVIYKKEYSNNNSKQIEINTSKFNSGLYIIKIYNDEINDFQKIIINK